jgi:hypothetical protein
VYIQDKDSGEVVAPRKGGAHGYFPNFPQIETGLIMYGGGIQKGLIANPVGLEDIAPTAAKLLGVPFNAPDGKVINDVIKK